MFINFSSSFQLYFFFGSEFLGFGEPPPFAVLSANFFYDSTAQKDRKKFIARIWIFTWVGFCWSRPGLRVDESLHLGVSVYLRYLVSRANTLKTVVAGWVLILTEITGLRFWTYGEGGWAALARWSRYWRMLFLTCLFQITFETLRELFTHLSDSVMPSGSFWILNFSSRYPEIIRTPNLIRKLENRQFF